jgi:hypothetical protein
MFKAYQKLAGFKRQGITGPNFYSPSSRRGSLEVKFYQVKSSKAVAITDWIKAPDSVSLHKF